MRMRSRLRRPEEVVVLPQLLHAEMGGEDRPLLRSAASHCASADFTPFPLSAFGAMVEVVGKVDGVVMLVAMGRAARCSLGFEKKGGAAEISEIGSSNRRMGELPLFPLLIKREGADVPHFRIKKPPTISPTTPYSTRAVRRGRGGSGERYGVT